MLGNIDAMRDRPPPIEDINHVYGLPSVEPAIRYLYSAASTTSRDDALIAVLTAQSPTQAAQITKLLAALTTGGADDRRRDGDKKRVDGWRGDGTPQPEAQILQELQASRCA